MATSKGEAPAAGLLGGKKILSGTQIVTGVNFNVVWGDMYNADIQPNISFGSAFSSPPAIVVTAIESNNPPSVGCSAVSMVYDSSGISRISFSRPMESLNVNVSFNWVAIGS